MLKDLKESMNFYSIDDKKLISQLQSPNIEA
jgi:hypothetical protein